ncbi:ALF repeat-containing protein [Amycolatopsis sp. NPDC026612]|uniref:ALF repeat-containing protein n=1 Tax=Amycolatopsis sp. NPDC026612 TaxID=3155466 RepID=UPI0033D5ABF2
MAGQAALSGTEADVQKFLDSGRQQAQNDDDRIKVSQLSTTGGPEVQKAAQRALSGTVEDHPGVPRNRVRARGRT